MTLLERESPPVVYIYYQKINTQFMTLQAILVGTSSSLNAKLIYFACISLRDHGKGFKALAQNFIVIFIRIDVASQKVKIYRHQTSKTACFKKLLVQSSSLVIVPNRQESQP